MSCVSCFVRNNSILHCVLWVTADHPLHPYQVFIVMKPDRLLLFAGFASLLLCSAFLLHNGWKEMNRNEKQFHTQQLWLFLVLSCRGPFVIRYDDSSSGQSESTHVTENGRPVSNGATEEHFSIKRTPDGFINTTSTRINFQQENWFESFLEVQHSLENTPYSTKVDL